MNGPALFRLALSAALLAPAAAAAQRCPDGAPRAATLGIGLFHCMGGRCGLNMPTPRGPAHDFSTEPRVWDLDPRGPAAGLLHEGDVITSVDGALVTTPEGGRRLARLRVGRPVVLGVRRGDEEMEVRIVPAAGCGEPGLVVGRTPGRPRWPAVKGEPRPPLAAAWGMPPQPPVRFGMQIECGACGWVRGQAGWEFRSATSMRVKSVDPGSPADRAGLRPGDVILGLAGHAFTEVGGAAPLRDLRRGGPVRVEYLRDGRAHAASMRPQVLLPDEM